jgi:MTH538 TIR-like domain (DUF1863)
MARRVFHSFHYQRDAYRVQQVRNMGVIEGQRLLSSNEWEQVKRGGDSAIKRWINEQMTGRSCVVVLIGSQTAGRRWVNYEIEKGWNDRKGLVGVHIHNLKDSSGNQSSKGANPFYGFNVNGRSLSSIVKAYDPPGGTSTSVYAHIKDNLEGWVEEANRIRSNY